MRLVYKLLLVVATFLVVISGVHYIDSIVKDEGVQLLFDLAWAGLVGIISGRLIFE